MMSLSVDRVKLGTAGECATQQSPIFLAKRVNKGHFPDLTSQFSRGSALTVCHKAKAIPGSDASSQSEAMNLKKQ
jgi:hypothetical protein